MTWGLVAVAGATVAGSVIGGNKADKAAQMGADSSAQQLAFQQEYYKPIMGMQSAIAPELQGMILGDFSYNATQDPRYQQNLNLMNTAASEGILNNQAVSGSVRGGNTVGILGDTMSMNAMNLENQMYNQAYNERANKINSMMGVMGMDAGVNQMTNTMNNASMMQQQNAMFQGQNMSNMIGSLGGIAYQGFNSGKF